MFWLWFPHDRKRRCQRRPSLGPRARAQAKCPKFESSTICSTLDSSLNNILLINHLAQDGVELPPEPEDASVLETSLSSSGR